MALHTFISKQQVQFFDCDPNVLNNPALVEK